MNTEAKKLISWANTLVRQTLDRGNPFELKTIVRTLILKHQLTISQVASLVPVSPPYISKCYAKPKRTKSSPDKNTKFKQIFVDKPTRNIPDWRSFITAALALVTISQVLFLLHLLFLY